MPAHRRKLPHLSWRHWLASLALVVAAVALAWLSQRYHYSWDWTSSARNSLTRDSQRLLADLRGPVSATAFIADDPKLHRPIRALIQRYQRYKPDLTLRFVDPKTHPDQARALNIPPGGALVLGYKGRRETLQVLNEQSLTNALLRLSGNPDRWIVFTEGHGERSPLGHANYDFSLFAKELKQRGLHTQNLELGRTGVIPDNTSVLVIAAPQQPFSAAEVKLLHRYVARGGDLLWLAEPGAHAGLAPLARQLGIRFLPGVVLSARSRLLGVRNPAFIVIDHYPLDFPATRGLVQRSLLPVAVGLAPDPDSGWKATAFLRSSDRSWSEAGDLNKPPIRFDPGTADRRGPIDLALGLVRSTGQEQQRVVVAGDSDFLSNTYLNNGANLQLGLNMIHWLSHDDRFMAIKPWAAGDLHLRLSDASAAMIAFGFPFVVPALLVGAGWVVRQRRRRRSR
ncbi:MAG: GldG family protein [Gammaproteobacteria bacterium]